MIDPVAMQASPAWFPHLGAWRRLGIIVNGRYRREQDRLRDLVLLKATGSGNFADRNGWSAIEGIPFGSTVYWVSDSDTSASFIGEKQVCGMSA